MVRNEIAMSRCICHFQMLTKPINTILVSLLSLFSSGLLKPFDIFSASHLLSSASIKHSRKCLVLFHFGINHFFLRTRHACVCMRQINAFRRSKKRKNCWCASAACVYFIADELIVKINKWNTHASIELMRPHPYTFSHIPYATSA